MHLTHSYHKGSGYAPPGCKAAADVLAADEAGHLSTARQLGIQQCLLGIKNKLTAVEHGGGGVAIKPSKEPAKPSFTGSI